jgi:regulator of sirC expression with transglutaminase-like and TPR domain
METPYDRQTPRAVELLTRALSAQPQRLDWAALAVAALENPTLDVEAAERSLDGLAARVRDRAAGAATLSARVEALRAVLADEEGFHGDDASYADPASSFLDSVLERRDGLPIALSVVYVEVARRAGIQLDGISFPGQFLVGTDSEEGRLVLDPFSSGKTLSFADCGALLQRFAPQLRMGPALLSAASVSTITVRMLSNLKELYLRQGQGEKALRVIDLLLQLNPGAAGELRVRAALLSALGAYRAALADVEQLLKMAPAPRDAPSLALAAKNLRERVELLN